MTLAKGDSMKLDQLLERLPSKAIASKTTSNAKREVESMAFLTDEDFGSPRETTLYFCEVARLPKTVSSDTMFNCITYGMGPLPAALAEAATVNLVRLSAESDPFACFNILQNALTERQVLTDTEQRLLAAHFSN